jgi:hypothetical protein
MFTFEYNDFDSQIARAIEQAEWFNSFEEVETSRLLKKLNKLADKFEDSDEDDFEEFVQKFFKLMKDWATDLANCHPELISKINKTMDYCNFEVIEIAKGSKVVDNASVIAKTFATKDTVEGIVIETAYAYKCNYIYDDVEDYFVARANVVVK